MRSISEWSTGYPGYNARIPHNNSFLSEILKVEGYTPSLLASGISPCRPRRADTAIRLIGDAHVSAPDRPFFM